MSKLHTLSNNPEAAINMDGAETTRGTLTSEWLYVWFSISIKNEKSVHVY